MASKYVFELHVDHRDVGIFDRPGPRNNDTNPTQPKERPNRHCA